MHNIAKFFFAAITIIASNFIYAETVILKASSIITMDKNNPRAEAIDLIRILEKLLQLAHYQAYKV